jgi:hypothetical protein
VHPGAWHGRFGKFLPECASDGIFNYVWGCEEGFWDGLTLAPILKDDTQVQIPNIETKN